MMTRGLCVYALLGLWVVPPLAAQTPSLDKLVRSGVELRKQDRDAEALVQFERAFAQDPSPRNRAQVALAQHALGRWVEAEVGVAAALESERDPWIARNAEPLRAALRTIRDHLGMLEVECNVDGAAILVDGRMVGTSPLAATRVTAGSLLLEVRADNHEIVQRRIDVAAGAVVKAAFVVVPTQHEQTKPRLTPSVPHDRARGETEWVRTIGWAALIAAGPLFATGITSHILRENNAARYADDARCFHGSQTRDQRCGGYRQSVETTEAVATVGYIGAGALLALSAVLLNAFPAESAPTNVRLTVTMSPQTFQLTGAIHL